MRDDNEHVWAYKNHLLKVNIEKNRYIYKEDLRIGRPYRDVKIGNKYRTIKKIEEYRLSYSFADGDGDKGTGDMDISTFIKRHEIYYD